MIIDTSDSIWARPGVLRMPWGGEVRQITMDLQPEEVTVLQVDAVFQDVWDIPGPPSRRD